MGKSEVVRRVAGYLAARHMINHFVEVFYVPLKVCGPCAPAPPPARPPPAPHPPPPALPLQARWLVACFAAAPAHLGFIRMRWGARAQEAVEASSLLEFLTYRLGLPVEAAVHPEVFNRYARSIMPRGRRLLIVEVRQRC
jgi:hypothetical protein